MTLNQVLALQKFIPQSDVDKRDEILASILSEQLPEFEICMNSLSYTISQFFTTVTDDLRKSKELNDSRQELKSLALSAFKSFLTKAFFTALKQVVKLIKVLLKIVKVVLKAAFKILKLFFKLVIKFVASVFSNPYTGFAAVIAILGGATYGVIKQLNKKESHKVTPATPVRPDLSQVVAEEQYFTYKDIQYAGSDKWADTATLEQKENMQFLAKEVLNPLRSIYGKDFKITSGFRSAIKNKQVRGSSTSGHLQGMAADITTGSIEENKKLFEILIRMGKYDQIIWEDGGRWIHIEYSRQHRKVKNKRLRMNYVGKKQVYKSVDLSEVTGSQEYIFKHEVSYFTMPV